MLGDFVPTAYVNGSAPGISAERLNNNEDKTAELDTAVASHAVDYVRNPAFGATTGAVNAYTFSAMAAAALVDGMSVYLDNVIAANTGAATFNWSGLGAKAIVDAKGVALIAGKMPLNGIIGLRYNASTTSFQLLGEGGEYGTAVAGDVVAGHTIGTAAGLVSGTVTEKVGSATVITPSTTDQAIPAGRYGGAVGDGKVLAVANASAGNIKQDIVIAGVTGTLPDGTTMKQYASGNFTASGTSGTVTGIGFTPTTIIISDGTGNSVFYRSATPSRNVGFTSSSKFINPIGVSTTSFSVNSLVNLRNYDWLCYS